MASLSSIWTASVRSAIAEFKCAGTSVLALPAINIFARRVCSCRVRSYCSSGVKISSKSFSPGRIPVNAMSIDTERNHGGHREHGEDEKNVLKTFSGRFFSVSSVCSVVSFVFPIKSNVFPDFQA